MLPFREIWLVDFEFIARPGERPDPVCLCALELKSGKKIRLWRDEFETAAPYALDDRSLFVSYFASAEIGCHLALGWPKPARVLDLFTEFRRQINGRAKGAGLLDALAYYGLDGIAAEEKKEMRDLILGGGPWGEDQRAAILEYCWTDVDALERLLPKMVPDLDLPRALLRGRYMSAIAAMEHNGTPIDTETLARLRERWTDIQDDLIAEIDTDYGVYDGRTFKRDRFAAYLVANSIPWPRLEDGDLDLKDNTFRQMAKAHPKISPLRELRSSLSELRLSNLAVGADRRNRCLLSPFASKTGRNQPSSSKYIFGPSVWLRGLIKPPEGYGVAYLDYSQQEFGIAAALSGDTAMMEAYHSGDPYLAFAKQAGAVPADATKQSHGPQRELFKQCVLATQYGMEAEGLAMRIGQPEAVARELLRHHKETYRTLWAWLDGMGAKADLCRHLDSVFGWRCHTEPGYKARTFMNFPMQANGAEMLRLACCLGTERGIEICAPVHDALLIAAPLDHLDQDIAGMRKAMAEASRLVLAGFEIGTDAKTVTFPDRYMDGRGQLMWDRVMRLIGGGSIASDANQNRLRCERVKSLFSLSTNKSLISYGSLSYETHRTLSYGTLTKSLSYGASLDSSLIGKRAASPTAGPPRG